MKKKRIWMKVTQDEYELPVAVANSATELAQILGIQRNSIYASLLRYKTGERKNCPFRVVVIEEDEEDV